MIWSAFAGPSLGHAENLQGKEVIIGDGECSKRYILCYNPKEAQRQKKHRSLAVEVLEKETAKHADKKATAQWAIELLASKRYKLERCFSALKRTQIKKSPMYHWLPRRIEKLVRIYVLALLIERVAELACQNPWPQIRQILDGLQVWEFQTPTHRFFKLNEACESVRDTLIMLGIPLPAVVLGLRTLSESQPNL